MGWQIEKARFNHDCLKNQLLTAIGKLIRILRGEVEEEGYIAHFTATILPSWLKLREQAKDLLMRFEREMTPARFFDVEPLSRMTFKERQWMTELLHNRWTSSPRVHEIVVNTNKAISAIDTQYEVLNRRLTAVLEISGGVNLDQPAGQGQSFNGENLVRCAEIFYQHCYTLSDLLSHFPPDSGLGWIDQINT